MNFNNRKVGFEHWKTWTIVFENETHIAEVSVTWKKESEAIEAAFNHVVKEFGQETEWELKGISSVPYTDK